MTHRLSPLSFTAAFLLTGIISMTSASATPHAPHAPHGHPSPMGINVGSINDWNTNIPFIDVFKMSRPFINSDPTLNVDDKGWVKSLASGEEAQTFILWDIEGHFPTGEYTVLYEGDGILKYGGGARMLGREKGVDRINVNANQGGIHLKITKTNPDDYIRNIRVLLPGGVCASDVKKRVDQASQCPNKDFLSFKEHHEKLRFNPDFLRYMTDFSVLRFMDFMRVNDSEITQWSERTPLESATWAVDSGAPIEVMVDLANRLKADPWFTMPHQAEDDYVKQFATFVKENLDPPLKTYIEYTNEAWNGQFRQFRYMIEKGEAANLDNNPYQAGFKYYSLRSVEVLKIWEKVINDNNRLVRVMAGQAANSYIPELSLSYKDAYKHVDAIAIAPYFGGYLGDPERSTENLSLNELFVELRKKSLPESIQWMKEVASVAKKYNVDMIAYEGAHHLVGVTGAENNRKLNNLFDRADTNPQMKALYHRYFNEWKKAGGQLFAYYSAPSRSTKWGRWGLTESLYQSREESPKYDAVLQFIEDNPKWW